MTQQEEFQKYLYLLIYEREYHKEVIFGCSATLHKNVNLKKRKCLKSEEELPFSYVINCSK